MRNLLNPRWLFIINTAPIVVLFFIQYGQFNIIKSLLDEESVHLWKTFGLTLGILGLLNFVYAAYLTYKRLLVSIWYALLALLCYIPFIYQCGRFSSEIIPFSVPQWMISGNVLLYAGTFLMPTLIYALFVLVIRLTPEAKEHRAGVNFLISIAIPVVMYLFVQVILPLWQPVVSGFFEHVLLIVIIVTTIVFLFFLIRGIFILATKKSAWWERYQLAWKIPIGLLLPILGLVVNNGGLFRNFTPTDEGIFGDFNNHWFYILAVLNGVLICLPNLNNRRYRLILLAGRSITYAYTFYFFMVFLPFLPLSVIAIIAIGTGFLMLTPLALFVIHTNELAKDYLFLKTKFPGKLLIGIVILGFLVIPALITASYMKDKQVLNETLEYIYSPDYSKQYHLDKASLEKTLTGIKYYKNGGRGFFFAANIPYLSSYYNWLVLDNLTLSDSKIKTIESVFFGKSSIRLWRERIRNDNVSITNITTKSEYDSSQNAWKSWIDLEITNANDSSIRAVEYATTIELPVGCWISDYYLFVKNKKESGILAEKRSAMWVFSQIRGIRRDPGILYYLTGNTVALRVFPFAPNEVRKTGIELIHKEPMKLTIDNYNLTLGKRDATKKESFETDNIIYVSAREKQTLNPVHREPYFHFLIDVSENSDKQSDAFIKRIETTLKNHQELSDNARISFVNSYVHTLPIKKGWKQKLHSQDFNGGFYLDRAIRKTLFDAFKNNSYPIMVVVTDSIKNAILTRDFSDFQFAFPESNLFFDLKKNAQLQPHSLSDNPKNPLPDSTVYSFDRTVLEYLLPDHSFAYLPNNNAPSIILKNDIFEITTSEIKEKNWQSGLTMQGSWRSQILHPETSDSKWLNLVKYSFMSKIMTPLTSYLVVENEAQKAILKKKQEQVLSGNKSLDPGEESQQMSEPALWILVIFVGIFILCRERVKISRNRGKPLT